METMTMTNPHFGSATVLSPVPGTEQTHASLHILPAECQGLLDSPSMTRQSQPRCLHCAIRCYSVDPETLVPKAGEKANTSEK